MTTASLLSKTRYSPLAACKPWLIAAGNPRFSGVGDDRDRHGRGVPHAGEVGGGLVGRAVIDDDQLPRGPGVAEEGLDAQSGESRWFQQGTMIEASPRGRDGVGDRTGGSPFGSGPPPLAFCSRPIASTLDLSDGPYEP